uniref:golgin subfamily A member 6-like protein 25 n=1 Tax=Myxine glutinosa TaxID=7769 RepID=UPI00358FC7D0
MGKFYLEDTKIEELQKDIDEVLQQVKQIEKCCMEDKKEIEELGKERDKALQQVKQMEKYRMVDKKETKEQKESLRRVEEERKEIVRAFEEIQRWKETAEMEWKDKEVKIKQLEEEKMKIEEICEVIRRNVEKENKKRDEEEKEREHRLKENIEERIKQKNKLQEELNKRHTKICILQSRLQCAEEETRCSGQQLKEQTIMSEQLVKDADNLQRQFSELKQEYDEQNVAGRRLPQENLRKSAELTACVEEIGWLKQEMRQLKEKVRLEKEGRTRIEKETQRGHNREIGQLKEKMRLESDKKEKLVKEIQKDHYQAMDKLKEKMRYGVEGTNYGESDVERIDEEENEKELSSSFLKCFAHQGEEAWQKEKVHGTQGNPESGILEKNEQIDAESGCDKEDGTAKEEADGEDEELSSYQMTQEIQPSTDIVKCLQGNLMQSLEEEMNRSGSDGHGGEVEIGAQAKSKAVNRGGSSNLKTGGCMKR